MKGQRVVSRRKVSPGPSQSAVLAALATVVFVATYSGAFQENQQDITTGTVIAEHLMLESVRGGRISSVFSCDARGRTSLVFMTTIGYEDLRLMSPVNDVSGIPTAGKNLTIVAVVDNVLHFRIFDRDGKVVVDTDEKKLTEHAQQIEDLRKQVESLRPPHELTRVEAVGVIAAATSIVGHTPRNYTLWLGASDSANGAAALRFSTEYNQNRLLIEAPPDGSPRLLAGLGESSSALEFLVSSPKQTPSMSVRGNAGKTGIQIVGSGSRDDSSKLSLRDRKGTQRVSLYQSGEIAFLVLTDMGNRMRAAAGVAPPSPPGLLLFDRGSTPRLEFSEDRDGMPAIKLHDPKENRTTTLK